MLNLTHNIWALFAVGAVVAELSISGAGLFLVLWWLPDHRIREFDERSWFARHWRIFVAAHLLTCVAVVLFNVPLPFG